MNENTLPANVTAQAVCALYERAMQEQAHEHINATDSKRSPMAKAAAADRAELWQEVIDILEGR